MNGSGKDQALDNKEALKWLEGDDKMLNKIKQIFVRTIPGQMESLRVAIEGSDAELVERLAHSIKGSSSMIGALLVRDEAFKMELAAQKGETANIRNDYEGLRDEILKVLELLRDTNES